MTPQELLQLSPRLTRAAWCDNAGLSRAKAVTPRLLEGFIKNGIGMTVGQQALPMMLDAVIEDAGLAAVGEVRLIPDLESALILPYAPDTVMAMADMVTLEGNPWSHCPRDFLKRQLEVLAARGFIVRSSFENEFYLFKPDRESGWIPLDGGNYATLDAFGASSAFTDALLETLEQMGLEPESFYPESGPGQQEIPISSAEGLASADRQIYFKAAVKAVAAAHGLRASFCAKPLLEGAGSGCHLHLSLWKAGQNAFFERSDPLGLSSVAYASIAGILEHARALCALTVPSVNSYRRLQPGMWAGAYSCYGLDNREASVRVLSSHLLPDSSGASAHFELKTVDGSSNPYLALGAVLAAVNDGLERGLHPGAALEVSPQSLSEIERAERGILTLPSTLEESIVALETDTILSSALGPDLKRSFVAVRREEARYFREFPALELEKHRFVY